MVNLELVDLCNKSEGCRTPTHQIQNHNLTEQGYGKVVQYGLRTCEIGYYSLSITYNLQNITY